MNTALIITVGNTADPILKAIAEVLPEGRNVSVHLAYGRPFPGQPQPTPFDVAHEAKRNAEESGVAVRLFEISDPEDIDVALKVCREIFSEAMLAKRVIVNFTGGTKVLSAAVVHAALSAVVEGELILDYTGGVVRDDKGRVIRESMRVKRAERTAPEETLQQVMQSLRRADYRDAAFLGRFLPDLGRAGFVKKAAEALALWDEFDYDVATRILQRLNEPAKALADESFLAPLFALTRRLLEVGNRLCAGLRPLQQLQQKAGKREVDSTQLSLLVADTLENGARRIQEGRATDAVLRMYRAVEVATQVRLVQYGMNPWFPDWSSLAEGIKARYLQLLGSSILPRDLALYTGLKLLEAQSQPLSEETWKRLKDLQQSRNLCYLEHGYQRLDMNAAERLHSYAAELCAEIHGPSLEEARLSVRHWN